MRMISRSWSIVINFCGGTTMSLRIRGIVGKFERGFEFGSGISEGIPYS